jgi:hypothetical protein
MYDKTYRCVMKYCLFYCTVQTSAWRDWGKSLKSSISIQDLNLIPSGYKSCLLSSIPYYSVTCQKPGQRSWYSDWLQAGQLRGQSLGPGKVKNFVFSKLSRPALGSTQPPIQWHSGALTPGVKLLGYEADHSYTTSAEVKKMWIYTSIPHTPSWHTA